MLGVRVISSTLARETVQREHYLHRKPPVSYAYGLFEDDELVGVVTFGTPASRELMQSACPGMPEAVIELNRLWVHDDMPKNTESWFVSRALTLLGPHIVVSFADTRQGHHGGIYRALNFHYAGWTDMERKSARWDYIPLSGGHSRDASRRGWSHRIQRKPKVRYWIVNGNRTERKFLTQMCAWPKMSWIEEPPPTEHRQRSV